MLQSLSLNFIFFFASPHTNFTSGCICTGHTCHQFDSFSFYNYFRHTAVVKPLKSEIFKKRFIIIVLFQSFKTLFVEMNYSKYLYVYVFTGRNLCQTFFCFVYLFPYGSGILNHIPDQQSRQRIKTQAGHLVSPRHGHDRRSASRKQGS